MFDIIQAIILPNLFLFNRGFNKMARKHAEQAIIDFVTELTLGDKLNADLYRKFFKTLNNAEFDKWIHAVSDINDKSTVLHITTPVWSKTKLSVEKILEIGDKYNLPLFKDIVITQEDGTKEILPNKVLVCKLPLRRASQVIEVQMKSQDDDGSIDKLTGQPAGDSASGRLSLPETDILGMYGFDKGLQELLTVRGGDLGAYKEYKRSLLENGEFTLSNVMKGSTRVESLKTLKELKLAQYINTNL